LKDWEKLHGHIPDGAIVVMHSGWGKRHHSHAEYFGASNEQLDQFGKPGANVTLHFPGFSGDAASWLVQERFLKSQR